MLRLGRAALRAAGLPINLYCGRGFIGQWVEAVTRVSHTLAHAFGRGERGKAIGADIRMS